MKCNEAAQKSFRMKRIFYASCFCAAFALYNPAAFAQTKPTPAPKPKVLTAREIADLAKYSVFTVVTDKSTGTGFSFYGKVMTCFHVIKDAKNIAVRIADKEVKVKSLDDVDEAVDCAGLVPEKPVGDRRFVGDAPPVAIGDKIFVVGSPRGLEQTISEGIVSSKRKENGISYLQISAPISPGSSGSPVFDQYGNVIGMVVSTVKDSQQLNFAVAVDELFVSGVPLENIVWSKGNTAQNGVGNTDTGNTSVLSTKPEIEDVLDLSIPHKAKDYDAQSLADAPDFQIVVENLPDELSKNMNISDIRTWVEAELSRSAPKAVILADKQQKERFDSAPAPKNVVGLLKLSDARRRYLYVRIGFLKNDLQSTYSAEVSFARGVVTPTGIRTATVYSTGGYSLFGTDNSASDKIRDAVKKYVQEFADLWSIANK